MNIRYYLSLIALFFSIQLVAQKTPEQMAGVYYAYPEKNAVTATHQAPPNDFVPMYISHYGRHGSRWLTSDDRYQWVITHFKDKDNLTSLGRDVNKRLHKVWLNAKGNGGQLSPVGARQHQGIARRMFEAYPEVFKDSAHIEAFSSTVPRCQNSMMQFFVTLYKLNNKLFISSESDEQCMTFLVNNTNEQKQLEKDILVVPQISPDRFMQSLFKNPESAVANGEKGKAEAMKLMTELFTIAGDMQDVGLNIDFFDLFTQEEIQAIYDANNKRMTMNNGRHPHNNGTPMRSAVSLWQHIKDNADRAIGGKEISATLRFGHDTNLYRLLTLIDLRAAGIHNTGENPIDCMDEVLPMAANLQMVFYHAPDHVLCVDPIIKPDGTIIMPEYVPDILVRFMLNEQDATLPLRPYSMEYSHYYYWHDVKKFVEERIHEAEHLRQLSSLNTMVGTATANTQSAGLFGKGSEEHGQTLPAVLSPNGQNFWTPQTRASEKKCVAPYYYQDYLFQGFRNSHWIVGGCTQDYGSFTVAAITGDIRTLPEERATPFSHNDEISHPHYYSVRLPQENLSAEITGSSHAAIMRFTPKKDGRVHILIDNNNDEGEGNLTLNMEKKEIYGYNPVHRIYQGWGEKAGFSGHFLMKFSDEIVDYGIYEAPETAEIKTKGIRLTFEGKANQPIELRVASSFTGKDGCERNMFSEIEGRTFEQIEETLADRWVHRLHDIDVEDNDTAIVNQFYGALYRASFLPREISDDDGSYPRFASGITMKPQDFAARAHYTDFSMWDTYRAVHPLYNIIEPSMSGDMMQSLVDMYSEGGWMPIFPCWNSYTAAMIGDHCAVALADAYIKGVTNFDAEKAYEGMRRNAFESPATKEEYINGMGRRALESYLKYGYIPLEDSVKDAFHTNEQTSRTLEYAFDDFAVAQMARALGHNADYTELMRRSENWRNVINPLTGWADGRHANGTWLGNTDIIHRKPFITEGATCHYTWYVPHNISGLMEMMGGDKTFTSRLDSMFTEGRYWHGNEPCHQMAYLFDYTNEAWRTQKWVRHIMQTEYNDTPGGLSGNDDAGQMSAWYLFSAMGFYPVCPSTPNYTLGSPMFRKVTINLENDKAFTIETVNASPENIYVKSVTLNGQPLNRWYITHDDILSGGILRFGMSNVHE